MEFIQLIAKDIMHLCFGLYGISIVYLIVTAIYDDVVEGLANWIGTKINKYRTVGSK